MGARSEPLGFLPYPPGSPSILLLLRGRTGGQRASIAGSLVPKGRVSGRKPPKEAAIRADRIARLHRRSKQGIEGEAGAVVQAKKIALYVIFVFVAYTIITSPARAADLVQVGFEGVSSAAQGVGDFMSELVK